MMAGVNWTCPHCDYPQVRTNANTHSVGVRKRVGNSEFGGDGDFGYITRAIACQNPECTKVSLELKLGKLDSSHPNEVRISTVIADWRLLPESSAKPQPDYIPEQLRNDYVEACRIRDLSPKASATLARRCLQGMIRDFCGISKGRLIDEIRELRKFVNGGTAPSGVTPESVDAIDNVRSIGNIGAHMEKDIGLIVDIDPDEAQLLIELIETLFADWYVERQKRAERFAKIAALKAEKDALKAAGGAERPQEAEGSALKRLLDIKDNPN
jgi:hypothetical protein